MTIDLDFQIRRLFLTFCFLVLMVPLFAGPLRISTAAAQDNGASKLINDLGQILDKSLETELKDLEKYKERLAIEDREQNYLTAAYNGYRLQLSTFWNLLLSTGTDISALQKTRAELKSSMVEIQKMKDGLAPDEDTLKRELKNLEQQKQLVDKQIKELVQINADKKGDSTSLALKKTADRLADVLKKKEAMVTRLDQIYQTRMTKMTEVLTSFSDLGTQLEQTIEERKAKNLFERKSKNSRLNAFNVLLNESLDLWRHIRTATEPGFWINGAETLWQSAGLVAVSFIFVFLGGLAIFARLKAAASGLKDLPVAQQLGPWHLMAADLLKLSIIPGGTALTIFLYSRLDKMVLVAAGFKTAYVIILIFLVVRWIGLAISGPARETVGDAANARRLGRLSRGAAYLMLAHTLIQAVLGTDSGLLILLRMAGTFWLLVWTIMTWKDINGKNIRELGKDQDKPLLLKSLLCKYLLMSIAGVALVMDMTGYGSLSFHWLISWIKSIVILFWWGIFYAQLKEWDHYYKEMSHTRKEEFVYDDYPLQWLMIRAGQFCWLVSLLLILLLTWGNPQTVLGRLYQILAYPLSMGSMNFSLLGIVSAGLVLIFTYALIRMWRWLFQTKFLSRSGMARGLQESITTISVYVIWSFGILISLHVFGLNTASMAVAFGALGIGIGFGLQNIFNNFISGIILLFERPIQVGDDVEVNGVWARVQKINVRSTVVQTYDNASLIIPNADFISSQVTNWSFKDRRIRRNINVGVAYGSDVELVKKTLLEIAAQAPRILRYPVPNVLFTDFGDSALNFRLRIWTDVDNMLEVETDVRFRIDREFRKKNIEISFPQRDIHIRSVVGGAELSLKHKEPAAGEPEPDSSI